MQARSLAEVLLAIVAIWYLAGSIPTLSFLTSAISERPTTVDDPKTFQLAYFITNITLSILVSAALLIWRRRIAERLVPQTEPVPSETPPWQAAAFAVLGVFFFVRGVSGALPFAVTAGLDSRPVWELISDDLFQALLGLGLFFGAPGLSAAWHRLRTAGHGRRAA